MKEQTGITKANADEFYKGNIQWRKQVTKDDKENDKYRVIIIT